MRFWINANMASKAVRNEIPNNYYTTTSKDTYQEMITEISQRRMSMEIKGEDDRELYRTKPQIEMITEWRTKRSRNYHRMACQTECQPTRPEGYKLITAKPINILSNRATKMATAKLTKKATKLSSNWLSLRSSYWDPTKCRIKRWCDLCMQCTKRLSESRSVLLFHWVCSPPVKLTCSNWINDTLPTPNAIGVNSATPQWSPQVRYANYSFDARRECSYYCPRSRRDPYTAVLLSQKYVNQSGSNTQPSQTLRATSPVLPSTSSCSQTPLELRNVLLKAPAILEAHSACYKIWPIG